MPEVLRLPLGGGIDRYPGVMETRPGSMRDLDNMVPEGMKLRVRRGTTWRCQIPALPDEDGNPACSRCSHIICIQSIQTTTEGLVVAYYDDTREVHVYRVSGAGYDPVHIGHWFTLDAGATEPPVVVGAESYGKAFLAHDERRIGRRAATQVYDATAGTMEDLEANLDGRLDEQGNKVLAPVKFRGVVSWLGYMIGWGYGTPADERPEIVRVSKPGEPTVWPANHYWIAGDRASPVTACVQAAGQLLVMKAAATFRVVGTSPFNFGIVPQYSIQGCLGSKLAITVDETCYAWGIRGPWRTSVGSAQDLAPPLDLLRDEMPKDPAAGFAVYIPTEEVIEWHFGTDVYALVLKDGQAAWSTRTRTLAMQSGGFLYATGSLADPKGDRPTGHPEIVSFEDGVLTWRNVEQDADELLEAWADLPDEGWAVQAPDTDVTTAATQTRTVTVVPGHSFEVAVRYRRSGRYSAEYEGTPDTWPAASRTDGTAPLDDDHQATISEAKWSRVSSTAEQVRLTVDPGTDLPTAVFRDGNRIGTVAAGQTAFVDRLPVAEAWAEYTVAALVAQGSGGDVLGHRSAAARVWSGPDALASTPRWQRVAQRVGADYYRISWDSALTVQVRADRGGSPTFWPASVDHGFVLARPANPLIELRVVVTAFGVQDFSDWVQATPS